jgi:hypothetical protein
MAGLKVHLKIKKEPNLLRAIVSRNEVGPIMGSSKEQVF